MLTTFRAKLTAIVGVAALALVVLIGVSSALSGRVASQLNAIQQQYVPKLELGPQLESQFDQLRRSVQDAVAARDGDALDESQAQYAALLQRLAQARGVLAAGDATALETALDEYYHSLVDVSRRMISGETGEQLVDAMSAMQAKQNHTALLLKKVTTFDRAELVQVFAEAARAQQTAGNLRLFVSLGCLLFVISLSLWLSREVLQALAELSLGLERVGRGDFEQPIVVHGNDELADVARRANAMVENLRRLQTERERADWLRAGRAGLTEELRGELSPEELGKRAVRFVARYLGAPVAALYYVERESTLRLAGEYGLAEGAAASAPTFRLGEGLLGQACLEDQLTVLRQAPAGFLRARSGLGESDPSTIVFLPLAHAGKATGVLELGLFEEWTERCAELLAAVGAPLAIAIEVSRGRAAMSELLEQTQRQAERLTVQEEELQATNEVLHSQQEELRQTNEELTQQTNELEAQQLTLREKNTELDEASQHLRQKAEELTKISTYKSQFLANMSHELRTPLNSMLLLSNLLADNDDGNLTQKQVEYCKTVHSAGKDLLALINQVLDLAKVEAGKQELRVETIQLARWVDYAERVFRPLANEKSLELRIELDPELPPSIATDPQRVQQVLNNLLANAIKFTQRGSVTLEIRRPSPGSLSDAPICIPTALSRWRSPTPGSASRRSTKSASSLPSNRWKPRPIGASEAPGSDSRSRASCRICSAASWSSRASPAKAVPSSAICRSSRPPRPQSPTLARPRTRRAPSWQPESLRPERRLGRGKQRLVHPKSGARIYSWWRMTPRSERFFGDVIRRQGLRFELVASGRAALELCRKRPPSGIILDVKLPDLDGWQVMEELRRNPLTAGIPVHFVSAASGAERALELGAIGYLTKPATRQDLSRVVEALAGRSLEPSRRILLVEHAADPGDSLGQQLIAERFEVTRAMSAKEALSALANRHFLCAILDLALPDMSGLEFLQAMREQCGPEAPAVVAYSPRPLSRAETKSLEAYAEAIVLKEGSSSERLLDEVQLFVRRLKSGIRPKLPVGNAVPLNVRLEGKRVLIVDDDMRTVYALSATLRAKGADVLVADTGHAALGVLAQPTHVDAVLMDIMMPELDGYETMRRIRQDHRHDSLQIIALTAKAMKGDRDRCLEVGASDYLPKPIDPERLLAMLHERLNGSSEAVGTGTAVEKRSEGGHAS